MFVPLDRHNPMLKNRQAWLAVMIALLTGYVVIAAWETYQLNWILSQMVQRGPSAELARKFEQLESRLKSGQTTVTPAAETKIIRAAVALEISNLRDEPTKYDPQLTGSRRFFSWALALFCIQCALAIWSFFIKPALPRTVESSPSPVLSNSG